MNKNAFDLNFKSESQVDIELETCENWQFIQFTIISKIKESDIIYLHIEYKSKLFCHINFHLLLLTKNKFLSEHRSSFFEILTQNYTKLLLGSE